MARRADRDAPCSGAWRRARVPGASVTEGVPRRWPSRQSANDQPPEAGVRGAEGQHRAAKPAVSAIMYSTKALGTVEGARLYRLVAEVREALLALY
jgi:hypothetical protein